MEEADQIRGADIEVSDIILATGLRFWTDVIKKQKIESLHSCKMVLDYLQAYLNDLNKFGGNSEQYAVCGMRRFKIKKSYVLLGNILNCFHMRGGRGGILYFYSTNFLAHFPPSHII